ncbi:MAG: DUF1289 domain-containing protein [Pseudomonadota bacterium]|nr:DUF1289 domain-containing protein [Pseudomonadota bacterium]
MAAGAAASPCTQVCALDTHDICIGCGRTLDEIAAWAAMTDDAKRTVTEAAAARLDRAGGPLTIPTKQGGHS